MHTPRARSNATRGQWLRQLGSTMAVVALLAGGVALARQFVDRDRADAIMLIVIWIAFSAGFAVALYNFERAWKAIEAEAQRAVGQSGIASKHPAIPFPQWSAPVVGLTCACMLSLACAEPSGLIAILSPFFGACLAISFVQYAMGKKLIRGTR